MPPFIASAARSLAMASLLCAVVLAGPLPAAALDQAPTQQAQAAPPAGAPPANPAPSRSERVEQRITKLHEELQVTPVQEPQWNTVAAAMRDHARLVEQAIVQRQKTANTTAVDSLKAYEAIAAANAAGLHKLIPAFEALYGNLSDDQKKKADMLFGHAQG